MARSQNTFNKKEREKKKLQKRKEKLEKKEERKSQNASGLEDMIVYLDEDGNFTDVPPDPNTKKKEIELDDIDILTPKSNTVNKFDVEHTGMVTFFNHSKGYGFIKSNTEDEQFFVHANGLLEEINEGNKVTFFIEKGQKGFNAVKVKRV